jgi:hypothetical protein
MAGPPVAVVGMKELNLALKILYPELVKDLHVGMTAIVDLVAADAVIWAGRQGFAPPGRSGRGSGALIGSIRSGTTTRKGYVKDTAMNQEFSYPRMYEYMDAGIRAFLHPAIDQNRAKIIVALNVIVEEACRKFNENRL